MAAAQPVDAPDRNALPPERRWMPYVELATLAAFLLIAALSYRIFVDDAATSSMSPPFVALLLVANLVPAIALIVLAGRRSARSRASRSAVGGGRLHVRLVGIFSLLASVPMLLVVVFSSLLFQYGVEFWFSSRARSVLENASGLAQGYYREKQQAVANEAVTMANDLRAYLQEAPSDSPQFAEGYGWQVLARNLNESAIVELGRDGIPRTVAMVNPDARPVERRVSKDIVQRLGGGENVVTTVASDRFEAVTRLLPGRNLYLYAARYSDPQALRQTERAKAVLADYDSLRDRARQLRLQFNLALFALSLLIVGVAVWIALRVADRLVRPVGELVDAARRVTAGDLTTRVAGPPSRDEVGTLAEAFNRMTARLEDQTTTLDRRRALIEAVLSGVSAGIVAVDGDGLVRVINGSGCTLLEIPAERAVGASLAKIAPEFAEVTAQRQRDAIVEVPRGGETRTFAVRSVTDGSGFVLTFDDITQRLTDQRRAAWADVARRIAHEIKNPLTPIQLAAERLQRRYGRAIGEDDGTFARLTSTIVRQVGDLRRMVDEFSAFARMPKPAFRPEPLVDIVREAIFLHEVAHPAIRFRFAAPAEGIFLVCDRRQLGQALTNVIKNAVEAIGQQEGGEEAGGIVEVALRSAPDLVEIEVNDTGIGLPVERERLVEPYMTTRAKGTGLGLAIVKKIVEEHSGEVRFADRPEGGASVTLRFDPQRLADRADDPAAIEELV